MNAAPYLHEFFLLMLAHLAAVVSPGADFAMMVGQSVRYGRRTGIFSALGIAAAIWLHIGYTLLGIAALLYAYPAAMRIVRIAGAVYIAYLAYGLFKSAYAARVQKIRDIDTAAETPPAAWRAFRTGFFTNALNPKVTVFFLTVFTVIVRADTPLRVQFVYGIFISLSTFLWFTAVAVFLSAPDIRRKFLAHRPIFESLCGAILLFFALRLLWL